MQAELSIADSDELFSLCFPSPEQPRRRTVSMTDRQILVTQ